MVLCFGDCPIPVVVSSQPWGIRKSANSFVLHCHRNLPRERDRAMINSKGLELPF